MPIVNDPAAGTIIDAPGGGTVKFGAPTITFTDGSTTTPTMIIEEVNLDGPYSELDCHNQIGVPNKSAYVKQKRNGSITLQIGSGLEGDPTIGPFPGWYGTLPEHGSVAAGGVNIMLMSRPLSFQANGITKLKYKIVEVLT